MTGGTATNTLMVVSWSQKPCNMDADLTNSLLTIFRAVQDTDYHVASLTSAQAFAVCRIREETILQVPSVNVDRAGKNTIDST